MLIRTATEADIPSITAIYGESVETGVASYELVAPTEDEMRRRFAAITADAYPYLAAEADGRLLGYAYASAFRTRPAYRWLVEDSIYLAPDARGRGIGSALLAELVSRCAALGFRQMIAVIGGAHPASVALHEKAGFAHAGRLAGTGYKHGRWLDTVLMQKALGEGTASDPDPARYPGTLVRG
jgi:Sortase and related acyltransferases